MRETPAAFQRRTGRPYAPPAWLAAEARPLGPREACPTLFRYPGPCGLARWFDGSLEKLGPPDHQVLWLTARPVFADTFGATLFGTLALLQPLRFSPGHDRPAGIYVAANRGRAPDDPVVWAPPAALARKLPWDRLATEDDARAVLARDVERQRPAVLEALRAYLEELDSLRRTGAPGPGVPWCEVPRARRRKLLAEHGVAPIWTR